MTLRERELKRNGNRPGIVKSAGADYIIPPNDNVLIKGYLEKKLPYRELIVMPQATRNISFGLDITPSLYLYDFNQCCHVAIEVSKVTKQTVSFSQKAIIYELQTVIIQDMELPESATSQFVRNILDKIKISGEIVTEERERCKDLVREYSDIFSKSATDLGTTYRVRHRIDLQDETPFKQK